MTYLNEKVWPHHVSPLIPQINLTSSMGLPYRYMLFSLCFFFLNCVYSTYLSMIFLGRGRWSMLSSLSHFFIQKIHWVEKFQIWSILVIQHWTNASFFFCYTYIKLCEKVSIFLNLVVWLWYFCQLLLQTPSRTTDSPPKHSQLGTFTFYIINLQWVC